MTRVIISGGGTGGHIFPAIAIANALKSVCRDVEILFIGALGKMEMEKVPAAGYKIAGLPVTGFQRRLTWKNLAFPFRLIGSLIKARSIISGFKPDLVIGVGGYASGPTLRVATSKGIPTIIQEQNSFPGVTNRILAAKVNKICVAYDGMERYFPVSKIVLTGNPIRQNLLDNKVPREEALLHFGLNPAKKTILVVGGSLGARTINEAVLAFITTQSDPAGLLPDSVQMLWQTGKIYHAAIMDRLGHSHPGIAILSFIDRMDLAYAAADLVISRAGAIAISELCILGKAAILVPSPNVAEDHQTKNARALVDKGAAIMVRDLDAVATLGRILVETLNNPPQMADLQKNISRLGLPDAALKIARESLSLVNDQNPNTSCQEPFVAQRESVYFLGIGGIGMSALARYFLARGMEVSGYDRSSTPLTDALTREGMHIHFTEEVSQIPPSPGLVVYTPAIPASHKELLYFKAHQIELKKRAEVLGTISSQYRTIAVAGTHGKTTTSTLIAHILQTSGIHFLAFLGGISKNYRTNYVTNIPGEEFMNHSSGKAFCVVEADEFDKSFLHLSPEIAIITSADADHLDIYGNHDDLKKTFSEFTEKIVAKGTLILKEGVSVVPVLKNEYVVFGYLVNGEAAFSARQVRLAEGLLNFDFHYPGGTIPNMVLNVPGMFNLENAVAALAVGVLTGISHDSLRLALATYEGVQRRFEFRIRRNDLVYIDDYAHHPEELRASITAARDLYPDKKITGIFQPHLFSRTRDLADDFASALGLLDELILMEIYPARELPIEGITSKLLLDKVKLEKKKIVQKVNLLDEIERTNPEVLLTLGAGDIDQFTEPISIMLSQRGKL